MQFWTLTLLDAPHCFSVTTLAWLLPSPKVLSRFFHLLRSLWFFAATFDIHIDTEHTADANNCRADMLSKNNITQFLLSNPQAKPLLTSLPQPPFASNLHRDQTGHQVPSDNALQILSLWYLSCYKIHQFIWPDKLHKLLFHDPTQPHSS